MKELCDWLKRQMKLAASPVREHTGTTIRTPDSRLRDRPSTPMSTQRSTKRYTFDIETPSSEKKRKISWEDVLHPFKARRLEKENRQPVDAIRGSFSLKDIQGAKFPGKQTSATSLCAILQAKTMSPTLWTPEVLDRLLLQGDKLHSTIVVHLGKHKSGQTDVRPDELPKKIAVSEREFSLRYSRVSKSRRQRSIGKSGRQKNKEEPTLTTRSQKLRKLLKLSLNPSHAGVLLTTQKETIGLFYEDSYCYMFHPCKVTGNLFSVNEHETVLSKFRDADHLTTYLCHKYIKEDTHYDLDLVDFDIEFDMWTQISFSAKMPIV